MGFSLAWHCLVCFVQCGDSHWCCAALSRQNALPIIPQQPARQRAQQTRMRRGVMDRQTYTLHHSTLIILLMVAAADLHPTARSTPVKYHSQRAAVHSQRAAARSQRAAVHSQRAAAHSTFYTRYIPQPESCSQQHILHPLNTTARELQSTAHSTPVKYHSQRAAVNSTFYTR